MFAFGEYRKDTVDETQKNTSTTVQNIVSVYIALFIISSLDQRIEMLSERSSIRHITVYVKKQNSLKLIFFFIINNKNQFKTIFIPIPQQSAEKNLIIFELVSKPMLPPYLYPIRIDTRIVLKITISPYLVSYPI